MKYKYTRAPVETSTIDRKKILGANIYALINILGKRARQINNEIREELHNKLQALKNNDFLDEICKNKEQIDIANFYESLPKPTNIAIQEFLDGEIFFMKKK